VSYQNAKQLDKYVVFYLINLSYTFFDQDQDSSLIIRSKNNSSYSWNKNKSDLEIKVSFNFLVNQLHDYY
jgi:hypothetical protein